MSRLRTVLLGTGFGRTVQAVALQRHPGFELVGLASRNLEKTRRIAGELGIPNASDDWKAMIANLRPDLVSVVTPPALHHPMVMAALEHGAHVLCEKPTALHRQQAAEMRDRAAELGRVAAINHEFRFFPARRHALDLVRRGAIGAPRRGVIVGRYPIWATPASRGMTWLSDRRWGGGILGALGSHHTDALRLFFGEPRRALATVRIDQPLRGPVAGQPDAARATADDACTVQYEFEGGATGMIDLQASVPYRWEQFEIHGAEASLRWDDSGTRLWRLVAGQDPEQVEIPASLQLATQTGDPALVAPFGVLADRLHRAITAGEPMEPDFADAVAVQSALDAARLSSEAGAWMRVEIPVPQRREAATPV